MSGITGICWTRSVTGQRNGFIGPRVAVNSGPAKVPIAKYLMDVAGTETARRIVFPGWLSLVLEGNLIGGEKS